MWIGSFVCKNGRMTNYDEYTNSSDKSLDCTEVWRLDGSVKKAESYMLLP